MSDRHSHPHDHSHYSMGQLASHLRSWHRDEDRDDYPGPREEHPHSSKIKMGENDAARIDVHPLAMPRFTDAEVVFAVMEGCLKADAVLTAIRNNDLKASVYSFPSVTLGNCPEFAKFSRLYLEDKIVVAILDADWAANPAVVNQGRIYQGKLLSLGIREVHLSAPPQDPKDDHGHPIFKGVDDFLGAGKGGLHELVCIDVEPPTNVEEWLTDWHIQNEASMQQNGIQTIVQVLTRMAVFAGSRGEIEVTLSCIANAMGVDRKKVERTVHRLVEMGAIEIDGILDTGPSFFGGGEDWIERPTITIHPDLRATDLPDRTTGDVLGERFFGGPS